MPGLAQTQCIACRTGKLQATPTLSQLSYVQTPHGKVSVRAQGHEPQLQPDKPSRRQFVLSSVNVAVLAEAALNQSDPRTVVNSLLGMISELDVQSGTGIINKLGFDEQAHTGCHS